VKSGWASEGEPDLRGLTIGRFWPISVLLAAVLGGCDTFASLTRSPDPPKLDPSLFPANYRLEVADFMRTYLNNPTKVKDAYIAAPFLKPMDRVPQYITCVRYNPRDTRNQYEGNQTNIAMFLGGRLVQFVPGNPETCNGLVYQRFPEIESMVP
jgi:hypothetical protein